MNENIEEYRPELKKISREIPLPTVEAVVIKDNKILLLRRTKTDVGDGLWWIPGGRVLYGETLETSLRRILFIETGLTVKSYNQLKSRDYFLDGYHSVGTPFIVEVYESDVLTLDDSHDKYMWCMFNELNELVTHPCLKAIYEEVFNVE